MTVLFTQNVIINSREYFVGEIYNLGAAAEATQIAAFTAIPYPTITTIAQPTATLVGPQTAATIQAAINAMGAAGGGTVQLPAGTILLSTSLVPVSGVKLKGVAPQLVYNTIPDSGLTTFVGSTGGTVLAPTGAFAAITWNTGALAAPASQTAFSLTGLTNIAFEDLGFLGGTYGIFAGATNNASCWYSKFVNLYFTGQTTVGISVTNYQHCQFNGNYTFGCAWGQLHQIDVASASLAPGNSTYLDIYNCNSTGTPGLLQRNVTFLTTATTGGAANNNEFKFDRIQSNRFGGASISQAATMGTPVATVITNTSANIAVTQTCAAGDPVGFSATTGTAGGQVLVGTIYYVIATGLTGSNIQVSATVGGAAITFNASGTPNLLFGKITITDGTKFAVGLPVSVDATQDGFTLKKLYFVVALSGNVIQLANTYGGAPIAATATTAVNIVHTGFPCFEMIALSGSTNTNLVIDNLDCEGLSTAAIFFQNVNGGKVNVSQVPSIAQATQSICCRGCANMIFNCPQSVSTDWDNNTVGGAMGFFGARFGTSVGYQGYGMWYDTVSAKFIVSAGSPNDTQSTGVLTYDPATAGGLILPKNTGIGQLPKNINSASFTVNNLNCVYSNGTAAAVNTLPTVSVANAGSWVTFINHTAGTQTINSDGVQLFNGIAGRTAITLNGPGGVVELKAVQTTTGPAYTWDVTGGTSAMVAGVVSAPT